MDRYFHIIMYGDYMKIKKIIFIVMVALIILAFFVIYNNKKEETINVNAIPITNKTIVLDAGHRSS